MLYVSTRNKTDSFTAYRAMHNDTTPDGGAYIPMRIPHLQLEGIQAMCGMSFGENVAKILNIFFSSQLSGWDVDFCIGRAPVKLENVGYKTLVAELWHNHDGRYELTRNTIYSRICQTSDAPSQWAKIAIDIAILFGVFCSGSEPICMDIALPEENTSAVTAAWYARKMGLPIGKILLICSENSPLWDFVLRGNLATTALKEQGSDTVSMVERMIFDSFGFPETEKYLNVLSKGRVYRIAEEVMGEFNDFLSAVAVGSTRSDAVIQSMLRTNGYRMSHDAAASFGGLQDHRARSGESAPTVLLSAAKP